MLPLLSPKKTSSFSRINMSQARKRYIIQEIFGDNWVVVEEK